MQQRLMNADKVSHPMHFILDSQTFYVQIVRFLKQFSIRYKIISKNLKDSSGTFLMKSLKNLNMPLICRPCF